MSRPYFAQNRGFMRWHIERQNRDSMLLPNAVEVNTGRVDDYSRYYCLAQL
jgi:hypothetical protein